MYQLGTNIDCYGHNKIKINLYEISTLTIKNRHDSIIEHPLLHELRLAYYVMEKKSIRFTFCIHFGLVFDIELLTPVDIDRKTSCKIFIFMDSEIDAKLYI